MKVTIGISNHHVHVTEDDFKQLFGVDTVLDKYKDINQPGQFAAIQKVDVETEKGKLEGLRILGPFREYTQVELSKTDCRKLKISAPVRTSGDLSGASAITIIGSCGKIVRNAAIIADRHIHITNEERVKFGLLDVDEVCVRVNTEKGGIFEHVKLKESKEAYFEMHLDTDDANGFLVSCGSQGEIVVLK